MAMGMGGGKDSSGPQGLGADAFGGSGRSNRIAFYMDDAFSKIALKAKENPAYTTHKQNIMSLLEAWDPQGQYEHNPHLDSLEPGVYNLGQVPYGQLYDWGLINQQEFDEYNMWGNQTMPTGKNFPLTGVPMPGVPMETVELSPTVNHSLINAVPLNSPAPNPDLKSATTGPGSYGWGGGSSGGI